MPPTSSSSQRPVPVDLNTIIAGETANLPLLKHQLSKDVAERILALFKISTLAMIGLVLALAGFDLVFIGFDIIEPTDRLISGNVVMSVIGATMVQVGAASFAITRSLFKVPETDAPQLED
jgi:hypothetical protein